MIYLSQSVLSDGDMDGEVLIPMEESPEMAGEAAEAMEETPGAV